MSISKKTIEHYRQVIEEFKSSDICKVERIILSSQSAEIDVEFPKGSPSKEVLNFCANNYLGLSNHPAIVDAARKGLEQHGYGMSSVR
ncbi:MAG: glycine C-acetyltransferase, partial [Ignavibacteriales bacterium]|nr:glycine C-acetyltransferase [Ignavibacteriales bacterium]